MIDRRFRLLAELPWMILYWRFLTPKEKLTALAGYKVLLEELEPTLRSSQQLSPEAPDPAPIIWAPIDKPYLRDLLQQSGADPDATTRVVPISIPPQATSYEGFFGLFSKTDLVRYLADSDFDQVGALPLLDLATEVADIFWRINTGVDNPIDPVVEGVDWLILRSAEWGIWPPFREVLEALEDPDRWRVVGLLKTAADSVEGLRSLVSSIKGFKEKYGSLRKEDLRSLLFTHLGGYIELV